MGKVQVPLVKPLVSKISSHKKLVSEHDVQSGLKNYIVQDENQKKWESLSKWLQAFPLRNLKLPAELDITKHDGCPEAPLHGPEGCQVITKVNVLKRFSSRK
eukprot:Pgem_evm1s7125